MQAAGWAVFVFASWEADVESVAVLQATGLVSGLELVSVMALGV